MINRLNGWMLAVVACAGLVACGGGEEGDKGKKGAEKNAPTANLGADDPGVAIQSLINVTNTGDMGAVWEALPASYQKDINEVVHLAAEKMDKEIYDKIFVLLAKGIDVIKKQKKFIVAQPQLAMISQEEKDKRAAVEALGFALEKIVESDLSSVERLSKMDVGKFLKGPMTEIAKKMMEVASKSPQNPLATAKGAKVSTVSRDGDKAKVLITEPGKEPQEYPVVRIDERWVPTVMGPVVWKQQINAAKSQIRNSGEMFADPDKRKLALDTLEKVSKGLDKLAAAETKEQFDQALGEMMQSLNPPPPPGDAVRPAPM